MYVYLDIDDTRARNNYKTFDEAVNSLREKCFGKEKEQKPIIKKDAEIFMTALKDHKVSVPDIDSGAKEGEEAFFLKPEKDENHDYEVQMFNRLS